MQHEPGIAHADRRACAWTAFWQEQGADSRCLAHAQADVRDALEAHWTAFAASLPPSSRVLDVGCGGGVVARSLLAARRDLRIMGIDLARVPAPSDLRIELLCETGMESLPLGNERFDAVVSQFGFEYGDVALAAKEVARVLAPGAPFSFVIHHSDSFIVGQSRVRDRTLHVLLGDGVKRAFLSGDAVTLDRQLRPLRGGTPVDPLVGQVMQALRARIGLGRERRIAVWNAIVDALSPERELIAALDDSCVAPDALKGWLASLANQFQIRAALPLCRPAGEVIAWKIEGARLGAVQISQNGPASPCASKRARTSAGVRLRQGWRK